MAAPSHHPSSATAATAAPTATADHPDPSKPDPTLTFAASAPVTSAAAAAAAASDSTSASHGAQGGLAATAAPSTAQLAHLKVRLRGALRQYQDFPTPGILFEDIMPIFAQPSLHEALINALELQVLQLCGADPANRPDVIVGLEARGFLFGPSLALRLGAGFVPVRKQGKLPGQTITAEYKKEYGSDFFQIQSDSIRQGQRVIIVDDIIATGGSATAAGSLVKQVGGQLLAYIFMMELDFLRGREKLDAPVYTLLSSQ